MSGDGYVELTRLRKAYRGYPKIYAAVQVAYGKGWRARPRKHGYRLICPCEGSDRGFINVSGSPQNQDTLARRILNSLGKCPSNHQLINRSP